MFVCKLCIKKHTNCQPPSHFPVSFGPCELCNEVGECIDVPTPDIDYPNPDWD